MAKTVAVETGSEPRDVEEVDLFNDEKWRHVGRAEEMRMTQVFWGKRMKLHEDKLSRKKSRFEKTEESYHAVWKHL